ncbi:PilW family protein [Luteimonas sp. FCS-9]|uniref:PilW family protein n=1 Tax=Luteimonas sp. FCS-9 TaxID=1547516 RepID=UPI00063ECF8E|nr:PilW family protein [Luteimonas sp. FCS-9]KLJ01742.1 pilus assembly protein PilW [Luteimonas sp. FCS-9]
MTRYHGRSQAGMSLVELMVALVIGSLLILGLIQVFTASHLSYRLSEGASRAQENARFAIDFLQRDIRMAGHFGCVNDQAHFVKELGDPTLNFASIPAAGSPLDFSVSVQGYEAPSSAPGDKLTLGAAWDPAEGLPSAIEVLRPLPGSDIIVLRFFHALGVPVNAIETIDGNDVIRFDTSSDEDLKVDGVATPELFGIGDCTFADVFEGTLASGRVTTVGGTAFAARYAAQPVGETMLHRADSIVYYVAAGASGEPALYRARADASGQYPASHREELVEGIESLQFLYGQDEVASLSARAPPKGHVAFQHTAAGVLKDVSGTESVANAWRRVGLVQVGILARSPRPAGAIDADAEAVRQRVLGVAFLPADASDGRYRTTHEVSVALRNRLFGN